jgi:Protein of unknown function (DUF2505).
MARQIDYRSTSEYPADEVYATMVDPDYLRARLEQIGGKGAALLEHHADAEGAKYRLRHGLDAKHLPSVVRSVLPGDLVIERVESWTQQSAGRYAGEVEVIIRGTPASAVGGMRLRDTDGTASELLVRADVTVRVPLIGGKIEAVVAEQVQNLLKAETAFTRTWLSKDR